jgi:cyclopropane-fatty-acyl-phospholipid synthase
LLYFSKDVYIKNHWRVSGEHYHKTCEAWLDNQARNREKILKIFQKTYGSEKAMNFLIMWRLFFLTGAESFRYNSGQEWMVFHYLFVEI